MLKETVIEKSKCQLSSQNAPVVHRDLTPPPSKEFRNAALHPSPWNINHLNGTNRANPFVESVGRLTISRGSANRRGGS